MSILVATFWENSNFQGNSFNMFCNYNSATGIPDLNNIAFVNGGVINDKISSLKIFDPNFSVNVFKNANYQGSKYFFRGKIEVPSLSAYGFNDAISSISISYILDPNNKQCQGQVIIYKDANLTGLSTWIGGPVSISDIRNSFGQNGSFPDNSISSLRVFPNTKVTLYKNPGFVGDPVEYINTSFDTSYFVDYQQVFYNDTCTSLKVEYYWP